jgi:NAD(P)-dependent dehydrogenase (short-subunit alcohol dehydrogenase family)
MKAETLFDIAGQVAIVTGAASGLGLAIAEVLAAYGARVTLADRDAPGLERAVARLRQEGHAAEAAPVDVADLAALDRMIAEVTARNHKLDIVFANAGISAGPSYLSEEGRMEAVSRERWHEVLHINLTSVFETIRAASGPMKRAQSGRIVATASIAGLRADPIVGYAYAATKAAVVNLVRQASRELAPYNVLVNAIAPGPFLTNIADGRLQRDPEAVRHLARMVPLGRVAQPDEIKGLALLLASPAASFITGAVIPIDGGASAG